jgi:hypothetical protein
MAGDGHPYQPRWRILVVLGYFTTFYAPCSFDCGRLGIVDYAQRESRGSHLTSEHYGSSHGTPGRPLVAPQRPQSKEQRTLKCRVSSENDTVPLLCLVAMSNLRPASIYQVYWPDATLDLLVAVIYEIFIRSGKVIKKHVRFCVLSRRDKKRFLSLKTLQGHFSGPEK